VSPLIQVVFVFIHRESMYKKKDPDVVNIKVVSRFNFYFLFFFCSASCCFWYILKTVLSKALSTCISQGRGCISIKVKKASISVNRIGHTPIPELRLLFKARNHWYTSVSASGRTALSSSTSSCGFLPNCFQAASSSERFLELKLN